MSFYSKVGTFNQKASTGSQAITGLGFQPKAVLFWGISASLASGAWGNGATDELGFAASSSQYFATAGSLINGTTTSTHRQSIAAAFSVEYNGSQYGEFTLTSFDADGFTLNWTVASNSASFVVGYLAIGGTDITNVAAVQMQGPTGTTTMATTAPGFKPDLVLLMGDESATSSGFATHHVSVLGAFDKNGNQWASYTYSKHGVNPSLAGRIQSTANCIIGSTVSATVTYKAHYTSMDTNGFTVTFGLNDGTARYFTALCIKGGAYTVGSLTKGTATQPIVDSVSVSGTPSAVLTLTDSYTTADATHVTGLRQCFGASDGKSHGCRALTDKNNVSPEAAYQYWDNTNAVVVSDNDTGTTGASGIVAALGPGSKAAALSPSINQGICTDGTFFYGTTTTGLYKFNSSWGLVASNASAASQAGASISHLGDCDYYNGQIYVAAVADDTTMFKNQRIAIYDATTLNYVTYYDCSAQLGAVNGADASAVAVDTENGFLWVASFWTGGVIYKYNLYTGAYVSSITPSPATTYIQGISYCNGSLYVAFTNSSSADLTGGVTKMNTSGTGQSVAVPHLGINQATTNIEIEGLFVTTSAIYLLIFNWTGATSSNVYKFGINGGGFSIYWNINNAVATQILYVTLGGTLDVTMPGVTGTVTPVANIPIPNVSLPGVTAIAGPPPAVEDACVLKFSSWPGSGVVIANEASTGSAYNATSDGSNETHTLPSGAKSWNMVNDNIYVPAGAAISNLTKLTFEVSFYYSGSSGYSWFWQKTTSGGGWWFGFWVNSGNMWLDRFGTDGSIYRRYWLSTSSLQVGYHILQIAWDATPGAENYPVCTLDNVQQDVEVAMSAGTITAWGDDSASSAYIAISGSTGWGNYLVWRLHSRILSAAERTRNYNAELWRISLFASAGVGANVAIPNVSIPGVTGTVTPIANAANPNVSIPSVVATATPTANVPIPNVSTPSVTATATPVANVPIPGVDMPPIGATVTPVANVPIPNVSLPGVTAVATPVGNVPLIIVSLPEVGGAVYPIANIPNIGVSIPGVTGTVTPIANAANPNVSLPGMTGIVEVIANVPNLTIIIYRHHDVLGLLRSEELRCAGRLSLKGDRVDSVIRAAPRVEGALIPRQFRNSVRARPEARCEGAVDTSRRCAGRLSTRGARCVGLLEGDLIIDT